MITSRSRAPGLPGLKLSIALSYYAAGDSYHSLVYSFRVAHNTISKIVLEVSSAIVADLAVVVISCPLTPQEWQAIADVFAAKWQFFHALGALGGKHVHIRRPAKGESLYYNYKGFHSIIILMALLMRSTSSCGSTTGRLAPIPMPKSSTTAS